MTAGRTGQAVRVTADREACIGGGMCVHAAPAVFDQDEYDGRVVLLVPEPTPEHAVHVRRAVTMCPVRALGLVPRDGARSSDDVVPGAVLTGRHSEDGTELA
ncbi:ferredoxin [Streptomyces sp. CA-249302]|uniref:ferredoxin n=1 Tax=Streptomyces sp. CA-249302 TaxID=3240058 RepID=UPI003D910A4F